MRKRTHFHIPPRMHIYAIAVIVCVVIAGLFILKYQPDFLFKAAVDTRGSSPSLYWKLNEASSTTINDSSGNSKTGTAANITWSNQDSCKSGSCISFNGTSSLVSRTYSSDTSLDPSTSAFTLSAWFKHPTAISGNQYIFARYVAGGYKVYMTSTGTVCFDIDSDSTFGGTQYDTACSTSTFNDNRWHFVEAVRNASNITLYIDNIQVAQDASLAATGSLSGTTPTFYVGVNSDGTTLFWKGFIDEVKYYAYARSSAQTQADMAARNAVYGIDAGSPVSPLLSDNLVGYWPMDEAVANTCTGGVNDSCDASGNGNDGAWTGAATSTATADTLAKYGQGVALPAGGGNYVQVTSSTSVSPTTAITFSSWVDLRTSLATKAILVKNNAYRMVTDGSGHPQCQISDGTTWQTAATSSVTLTLAVQALVTCTYNGTSVIVYVNGVNTGTSSVTSTIGSNANPIRFGSDAGGTYGDIEARIDDVRIYNTALTPDQVLDLYRWAPPPAGYWKLDEGSGTSVVDSSGNGNNGTFTNGPTWATGKSGNGVRFDGANDYISAGTSNSLTTGNNMTISAWIYPVSYGHNGFGAILYRFGGGGGTGGYEFETLNDGVNGTNTFCLWDTNTAYCAANNSITLNTWQHVAVVISNQTIRLYVNGVNVNDQAGAKSGTANLLNTLGATAWIGGDNVAGDIFEGILDEVKYYNYARTAGQIIEDMNLSKPLTSTGSNFTPSGTAVGYWKLNEGQGTTANNSGSGSSLNGTLTTMASPATSTSGWTSQGKMGKALVFDGTSDYVSIGNQTDATLRTDLTISAWINLTNTSSAHTILSKEGASGQFAYELYTDTNGKLNFDVSGNGTTKTLVTGTRTLATGTWYHVTGVYSPGTSLTLYVNGSQDGQNTTSIPATIFNGTGGLQIGAANAGTLMTGTIDEVKLYAAALTDKQVATEYNFGKSQVLGSNSTGSDGKTPSFGKDREYCVPGDTSSCAGPVAEWKMDENTGTLIKDTSGNESGGTLTSGPVWAPGKFGSSISFDGVNDYVTIPDAVNLQFGSTDSITLEAWFKSNSTSGEILAKNGASLSDIYEMSMAFGCLRVDAKDGSFNGANTFTSSNCSLADGQWHFGVFTYDRTSGVSTLYVDGLLDTSQVQSPNPSGAIGTTGALILGSSDTTANFFTGSIDNIRIFKYARSAAQVAWDYNRGAPLAYYKFNECSGSTINDSSGNGNTGTITIGGGGTQASVGTCSTASTAWGNGSIGRYGSSLNFDGTDDFADIGDMPKTEGVSQLSMEAWFKPGTLVGNKVLIAKGNGLAATESSWGLSLNGGDPTTLRVTISTTSTDVNTYALVTNAFTNGSWTHVVAVFDGTASGNSNRLKIYVNGKLSSPAYTGTIPAATVATASNVHIGSASDAAGYITGQLDNVKLYTYPLTPLQVSLSYNEGAAIHY